MTYIHHIYYEGLIGSYSQSMTISIAGRVQKIITGVKWESFESCEGPLAETQKGDSGKDHQRQQIKGRRGTKWIEVCWGPLWPCEPMAPTGCDTRQPSLLRELHDKRSCLSANICYSVAAWSGTMKITDLRATLKSTHSSLIGSIRSVHDYIPAMCLHHFCHQ